jgi:hypothetical protein
MRDKTCRFPGCCASKGVEAHHIRHWADGGETSLDNLLSLCRFHHTQLHRGLFHVRVEAPSHAHAGDSELAEPELVFSTPSGSHIETTIFPQFPARSVDTAETALREGAPDVNATTCTPAWSGDHCDYGLAIEALLRRDGRLLEQGPGGLRV